MRFRSVPSAALMLVTAIISILPLRALAANSVFVGSKIVLPAATGVEIGVYITNDVDVTGLVLPLEIREVTAGTYIANSLTLAVQGRVASSGLTDFVIQRVFAVPTAVNSCSGPVSESFVADNPIDFVSPDAIFWAGVSTVNPCLSPGSDGDPSISPCPTSSPSGTPSFLVTFDVTSTPGSFEIDTCCVAPGNHLTFVDCNTTGEIVPSFTKGVVTVGSPFAPVVLVHGWNGKPSIWDAFKLPLQDAGFQVWVADNIDPCGVPGKKAFEGNAENLASFICSAAAASGYPQGEPISIVAHSMGGLVARRLLASPQEFGFSFPVDRLIMLGTPNAGVSNATLGWVSCHGPAANEMRVGRLKKFNADFDFPAETEVFAAAGTGGNLVCSRIFQIQNLGCLFGAGQFWGCPNDGLVKIESVYESVNGADWFVPNDNRFLGGWCHTSFGNYSPSGAHLPYYEDATLLADWLLPVLLGQVPGVPSLTSTFGDVDTLVEPQYLWDACQLINQGEVRLDTILVDGPEVIFAMASSDSLLGFSLISPSGFQYDSTTSDSLVIFQRVGPVNISLVSGPEIGSWIVSYTTENMSEITANVCLSVVTSSSLVLTPAISDDYLYTTDSSIISASLRSDFLPVLNASVSLAGTREDVDTLPTVPLYDNGIGADSVLDDGVYSAWFRPAGTGVYEMSILASGTSGGTPFRRLGQVSAYVSLGSLPRGDMNRDGTFDVLDVVLLVNHVFRDAPAPTPPELADTNCDGIPDVLDVVRLVDHVFRNGLQPSC